MIALILLLNLHAYIYCNIYQNIMLQVSNSMRQQNKPMLTKPQNLVEFLKKFIFTQWILSFVRIIFIIIIYVFYDKFLCISQVWNFLFFVIAGLIDVVSLVGEVNTYKYLQKQQQIIERIQYHLEHMIPLNDKPRACPYQSYLSRYQIIIVYKYKNNVTSSTYTILRFSHAMCILVFGTLALEYQNTNCTNFLKNAVLIFIILFIYITTYQIDQTLLQTSKGKYQRIQGLRSSVHRQIIDKFAIWRKLVLISYLSIFAVLFVQIIFIGVYYSIQQLIGLFVVAIITAVFLLLNSCLQIYLILRARHNQNDILRPKNIQLICSPYQLLYEIHMNFQIVYIILTSGLRIMMFILFIAFAKSLKMLQKRDFWMIISILISSVIVELIKFLYGHMLKIDYLCPVNNLSIQKRIQMTCSICLANYIDNPQVIELPCSAEHIFHQDCINNWVAAKQQCPLCRYNLSQFLK